MYTLDFETEAIEGNATANPPKPVGLAVRTPEGVSHYYTDWERMRYELCGAWDHDMLFHNAAFDVAVARHWLHLPEPDPLKVFDTMYHLFLTDPHSDNLSLKPSAERVLNLPPEEQDDLKDWILTNVPAAARKPSSWGAYICLAPVEIVRPYAIGDVDRTYQLYEKLHPEVLKAGMLEAYRREQLLRPILQDSERNGIRVDISQLSNDLELYEDAMVMVEQEIFRILGREINLSSGPQLAEVLEEQGLVTEWVYTAKGNKSVSKDALLKCLNHETLPGYLGYRAALKTCLTTFARPWADQAATTGRIHTTWNQVRSRDGNKGRGTRTGRLSSSEPNLQNIPKQFEFAIPTGLPDLPLMRKYMLPEEGHVWLNRDFSSQEIRILAHFEDGDLLHAYQENPKLDPHEHARQMINQGNGLDVSRKVTKITAFSIVYGSGSRNLSEQLKVSIPQASHIKDAYLATYPGIPELQRNLNKRARNGTPMKTWGGRVYYVEPSRYINGRKMDFGYKMLNYLIQGSAADQTKQATIDWAATNDGALLLSQVHDELNISAPAEDWQRHMEILRAAMDKERMDVPFLSDGMVGPNWCDLEKC